MKIRYASALVSRSRQGREKCRCNKNMKKAKFEELRPEYRREELGPGVRGKYFEAYRKGTNLVLLSPDVAKAFPTEEAVNDVLRSLINVAQRLIGLTKRSSGRGEPRR